jgi:hypothetical protein
VFTARYALSPYIEQIRFVFKGLIQGTTTLISRPPRDITKLLIIPSLETAVFV